MCGRLNITSDPLAQFLMRMLNIQYRGQDNLNLAPTEQVDVVRMSEAGEPELVSMRWWLTPYWSKSLSNQYSTFNARAEKAAKSPAFRAAYNKRRCVVPISGFYEWCRRENHKQAYYIQHAQEAGLMLAGLWESWQNVEADEVLLSFTILTTAADDAMQEIHHRQPVFLNVEEAKSWLDMDIATSDLEHLLTPRLPFELQATPVSPHVNNARNKDERCTHPVGQALQLTPH